MQQKREIQAAEQAQRQMEIDMQNQEFHESLLIDQHKEVERKEAEEANKQIQAEEKRAAEEAEATFEAKRSRVEQPEPDKAHPDRCQIVIRTPSGQRLSRTFLGSDQISLIYDWIDVVCVKEEFVQAKY